MFEQLNDRGEDAPAVDPVGQYLKEIGRIKLLTAEDEVDLSKKIEAGLLASRILEHQAVLDDPAEAIDPAERLIAQKYLSQGQELAIISAEGAAAKQKFIDANLRLVVSIAKRYVGRGLDLLDLIQEGNDGLIKAVEKFDYTKGFKLSTYGSWWIRQSITRSIANNGRTIRIPVHMMEEVNKYIYADRRLTQASGRPATDLEISIEMNVPVIKVKDLRDAAKLPVELDRKIGSDADSTIGDLIEDKTTIRPEDAVIAEDLRQNILTAVENLDTRSAYIIKKRHGLDGGLPMSLEDVGHELGLTREHIRQLQKKAEVTLKFVLIQAGVTGQEG